MMRVFDTYLYEISKGTKPAALLTCENALLEKILQKLKRKDLSYFVQNLDRAKVNIFFGNKECIDVIEKFLNKPMCSFSPLEDFILGAILGYDIKLQCKRLIEHNKVK